jgi:hypothetical protein
MCAVQEVSSTLGDVAAVLGGRRERRWRITMVDVLAEVGASEVEQRCRELEAQGQMLEAEAIRGEVRAVLAWGSHLPAAG